MQKLKGKNNPQADVWFGGTSDPQAQAAELGLIEPYKSKHIDEIVERFRDPAKPKGIMFLRFTWVS